MSLANQHFYQAVREAYEPDWLGYQEVERAVEVSVAVAWPSRSSNLQLGPGPLVGPIP